MVDLSISSPALGGIGKVRLILPASWASQPTATWPSLYLLHGANEVADYTSWTKFTDVEAFMAGRDVLTVLPTDGSGGMYSAPWNYGRGGGPDYETFHTVELPQLLARGYRANATRVVAGLSIGGLGAFDYAARHPGLFKAAASYSGMLDTLMIGAPSFVTTIRVRAGLDPTALWGSTLFQRSIWNAHNPRDLAPKLVGIPLYVSSGDGSKGPFDTGLLVVDSIEPLALSSAKSFISRGNQLGLTMTTNLYKGGTHTWPYWQREFKASWPLLARGLSVPA
jgi:S-formylglutathione hydrolase FrmB